MTSSEKMTEKKETGKEEIKEEINAQAVTNINPPPEKMPEPGEDLPKKKKSFKKTAGIAAGLVLLMVLLACCYSFKRSGEPGVPAPGSITQNNYLGFTESWNEAAKKYSASFQFLGSNATSPENVIDTLIKWCAPFTIRPSTKFQEELAKLSAEMPPTSFHAYENFRAAMYRSSPLELAPHMDSRQLAKALNAYLGLKINNQTPDYVTPDTVRDIVYMNSFCQFFEHEKDRLHAAKIDTMINSCQRTHTGGKYPLLDQLLD